MASFERSWFDAPEAVAHVVERGVSDASEMADIAAAWTSWSRDPGACASDAWYSAVARAPTP
jgi:hypothetical protein